MRFVIGGLSFMQNQNIAWIAEAARFAALALLLATMLTAQTPSAPSSTTQNAPGQTAEEKLEKIAPSLSLSPLQERDMLLILEEETPKIEAIKANSSLSTDQKQSALMDIYNQEDPQVKQILAARQYSMWRKMRQQELDSVK